MTVVVTFKWYSTFGRMTVWNVTDVREESTNYIHLSISDSPDKDIPRDEIKLIKIQP